MKKNKYFSTFILTILIVGEDALKTTQTALNNSKKISVGDKISSDDLMKAVMIFSANDAAYLMADSVSGNYKDFVKMMNHRVKTLGLKNTYIVNPCGLESNAIDPSNKEINISTTYDMTIIAREAYKNQWIKETVSDQSEDIIIDIEGEPVTIRSRNKIIGQDGNIGGKTGKEIELKFSTSNYESKVLGKVDLSLFDLIKMNIKNCTF